MAGGTTIRDVVLRIRIEQADVKLRAPDTSAYKQALNDLQRQQSQPGAAFQMDRPQGAAVQPPEQLMEQFTAAFEQNDAAKIVELYKEVDRLAESVRAEKEAEKQAQKERDQLAKEAVAAYGRIMREREKQAAQEQKLAERTAAYVEKIDPTGGNVIVNSAARSVAAQDRLEQATLRNMAAQKQQLEVFAGTGEAAIRAARGIAFLTAANEEELKAGMRYVAIGQGVFDLVVGLANLAKQYAAAKYALAVAARTEAAMEVAAAAAHASTAVSANAAATATNRLTVAMLRNPITAALVAVTAGLAAAYWALSRSVPPAAEGLDDVGAAADQAGKKGQALLIFMGLGGKAAEELAMRNGSLAVSYFGVGKAAQFASEHAQRANEQWSAAMQQVRFQSENPAFDLTGGGAEKQIADIRRVQQERAKALREEEFRTGAYGGGVVGKARVEAIIAAEAEEAERQVLSIHKDVTKELERQQQFAANQLNLAKQTVEAEKARLQSIDERIGRLKPQDQARLRDIAKRRQEGGELSRRDAEFLDQVGVGGAAAGSFFRKEGEKAGAAGIREGLGENAPLEQATFGEASRELTDQIETAYKEQVTAFQNLGQLMVRTFASREQVKILEEAMKAVQRDNRTKSLTGPSFHGP